MSSIVKVTRAQILEAWQVYGTGKPLDPEFLDWLVEELNAELPPVELRVETVDRTAEGVTLAVKGFLWPWKDR